MTANPIPTSKAPARRALNRPDTAAESVLRQLEPFDSLLGQTPDGKPVWDAPNDEPNALKARVPAESLTVPQRQINGGALRFTLRLTDMLWVSAIIMISIWSSYIGTNGRDVIAPIAAGLFGTLTFLSTLALSGAHRFHPTENYIAHQKKVFFAGFSALGVWLATALAVRPLTFVPENLAIAGLFATGALFVLHSLYYAQIRRWHNRGALIPSIVMLGATDSARRLIEENAKSRELNIVAIFDDRLSRAPLAIHGVPVVGKVQDMLSWSGLPYIDRVVVSLPRVAQSRKNDMIEKVHQIPNRIAFLVDEFEDHDHVRQRLNQIAAVSLREHTGKPRSSAYTAVKRMMDVSLSSVALILGAPVLVLIAILIKLDSPGPVLFKQKRHGFNNREFFVWKFRSLRVEHEDKQAAKQVTANDDRVTKIGRFIRKTSLDELPQLWNVIKGDMSLVGPRPHAIGMRTGDVESYKLVDDYAHRHKVKPGMTGWAQINGSRGPLHNAEDVARRVRLDTEYIERASIPFDFMIMLMTIPCLLGDSENIR